MTSSKFLIAQKYGFIFLIPVVWALLIFTNSGEGKEYWLEFWWLAPIIFGISILVNTLGISGAALYVPFFILVFPLFAHPINSIEAVTLGLITESFGLLSSAMAFVAFGLVDRKIALYSILSALPFLIIGAVFVQYIPQSVLLIMIATLLVVSVFFLLKGHELAKRKRREHRQTFVNLKLEEQAGEHVHIKTLDNHTYRYTRTSKGYNKRLFGYGVGGFFQGAVGFGIGELGIISMILSRVPVRVAIGTSHLIVASTAIIASVAHFVLSTVDSTHTAVVPWNIIFMTVPAVILAGQISPYVASRLPVKLLEYVMAIVFITIAVALVFLALNG